MTTIASLRLRAVDNMMSFKISYYYYYDEGKWKTIVKSILNY